MKTDKNSQTITQSGTTAQPEQTVPDSNQLKTYKATMILAQQSVGSLIVEAFSPEEARQKAEIIDLSDVYPWDVFEDVLTVESVEIIEEGKNND